MAHDVSSIKLAQMPSPISARPPSHLPTDELAQKFVKEVKKRMHQAGRLTQAKESSLDYRLGIKGSRESLPSNPVSMKGWSTLIEDKVEVRCTRL